MGKAGQQVLILDGRDGDGHVLDPALITLVGCVVLDRSVEAVMPNSELNVLRHLAQYPGLSSRLILILEHRLVLKIGSWVVNPEAHFMNAFHPRINCGQLDDSSSIVWLGVLGVYNHWVSSIFNSHVLVAIRCPRGGDCRWKVGRGW